jgi:Ser/Thr protein kinase RdoA (MazF antagonist)
MEHLKQLGTTMSTMHGLLKQAPFMLDNSVADEYLLIARRMRDYFRQAGVQQALRAKLELAISVPDSLFALLEGCAGLPNQQVLHMDFVRGNILFDAAAHVAGVLDFEKTAWGHPLFDIARTTAFLLVDCKYKSEAQVRKYFLLSGYNKRGLGPFKITPYNARLLERLIDSFLLYDFYKFLRHNPYESLPENEHFVRTRQLLLQRQLLAPTSKNPHTKFPEGG